MRTLPLYQVDAFTDRRFAGNPAAVVPLETWPGDATLQAIAAENNLPETAFFAPAASGADYDLRWFTPTVEVDLCGHATLATAFVLATELGITAERVTFATRSGQLAVAREDDVYTLDFPANPPVPVAAPSPFAEALGATPEAVLRGDAFGLAVFADAAAVAGLTPDMGRVGAMTDLIGVIASAPGDQVDVVSRFFAPQAGIPEDPVTGSAHTVIGPYWAGRLGRPTLHCRQISARGGDLRVTAAGERVHIGGRCALYLDGRIRI
jgi:PhzF family phenazine biosynthesis protein